MSSLKVTQKRSGIGGTSNQRDSLRSLGLHRIGETSIKPDRPEIRGMLNVVAHLVDVEEVVEVAGTTDVVESGEAERTQE